MACKFICDGCGKESSAISYPESRIWLKPAKWYQRADEDGVQDACSRECIEVIAKKTGKTAVVAPF